MRYAQHCPIALAAEVVSEPWTLLIIRELLRGNTSVTDIAAGVPGVSAGLLTRRLRKLEAAGLVTLRQREAELTEAGRQLESVIEPLGRWGARWLPPPRHGDLDPALLLRDISRGIDRTTLPAQAVAIHFRFTESRGPQWWWLVLSRSVAAPTIHDPRLPQAMRIDCTLGALAGVWLGHTDWLDALRDKSIVISGPRTAVRQAIVWIGVSPYSGRRAGTGTGAGEPTLSS
ncbi:winged helix-turn-helix transcriptional regulator [Amycolatopsis regifaucium]|uniref:HxlR family transcriptional regulator n=1 Tax=Amycolatopsis regifaucium TaxID=546365 RepID=A0A154MMZ7_9PSEU|nr:helix-turn-helix domain-containing protein [Amycolatopsis regifaucium]KZB84779.1 HxlR family transcriptional regulator [Amycolatopsis regifaucium]OKA05238.1 HxlR family transcriptional regulator [Amycolatopsis regifaucium]SFJ63641.1 DNA-binding transcriptional regulator, HxlR family [Amycolatopsis regifaucium]